MHTVCRRRGMLADVRGWTTIAMLSRFYGNTPLQLVSANGIHVEVRRELAMKMYGREECDRSGRYARFWLRERGINARKG